MPREKTVWKRQVVLKLVCSKDARPILDETEAYVLKRAEPKGVVTKCLELDTTQAPTTTGLGAVAELIEWLGEGRLYVIGHGDWANQRVGNWDAKTVAELVAVKGAKFPLVSFTGCRIGRDKLSSTNPRLPMPSGVYLANSMDSFASKFHQLLGDLELFVDVYARVWGSQANKSPTILTMVNDLMDVGGSTDLLYSVMSEFAGRKLRFYWKDGKQHREAVDRGAAPKPPVEF